MWSTELSIVMNRSTEENKSVNCVNFQALQNFRIDAVDEILKDHFENTPKNATYRSKTIQNKIITCCEKYIQGKLLEEIKGKFFAVVANEATDSNNTEQLSLVIRFVDSSGDIREEFMEYIHCPSLGEDIANQIQDALNKYGLDMNKLQGHCYDGAGNMSGIHSGASSVIMKKFPKALYFHCSSHRLNLVVAANCKI